MANTRRIFTPTQKQEIVAYANEHGPKAAMEKYKIGGWSQINRWRDKAKLVQRKKGAWREKKWTDDKVAGVLDFLKTHTHDETMKHFKISSSQISLWRRGLSHQRKANGAATNGLGELPEKDALKWLETWRQAYFDRMKAETPSAAAVFEALRGGK